MANPRDKKFLAGDGAQPPPADAAPQDVKKESQPGHLVALAAARWLNDPVAALVRQTIAEACLVASIYGKDVEERELQRMKYQALEAITEEMKRLASGQLTENEIRAFEQIAMTRSPQPAASGEGPAPASMPN